jgi:hypothetical protein
MKALETSEFSSTVCCHLGYEVAQTLIKNLQYQLYHKRIQLYFKMILTQPQGHVRLRRNLIGWDEDLFLFGALCAFQQSFPQPPARLFSASKVRLVKSSKRPLPKAMSDDPE